MSAATARFVDHHVHLLAVAAGRLASYDVSDPASIAAYHRRIAAAGLSPMDEGEESGSGADELPAAFAAALSEAQSLGLAGVTEAGMRDWRHWDALVELRDRGELPIDVHVLVASGGAGDIGRLREAAAAGDDHLAIAGVKFYADGWLGPRTCACTHPFADVAPENRGVLFQDAARLARRIEPLAAAGFRPATHAIGDRAIEAVLDAYEQVYGGATGCRTARPRIEHAQVLRRDLIDRIVELGVVCCIQPCFASSDVEHITRGLGGNYPDAYRWDVLIGAGASVIAGSDFPIEPLDPVHGLTKLTSAEHPLDDATAAAIMTVPLTAA